MPILIVKDLARSDIDLIGNKMDGTYEPTPEGLIAQAIAEIPEGERVVEIWESQADYDRFRRDVHSPRMHAAIAELGDDVQFIGALSISTEETKSLILGK